MTDILLMGAVAYDPKVVTIWEGFKVFFEERGLAFDFILYSNYEQQVRAHFAGEIHVAWNSPLAWLYAEKIGAARGKAARAVAMRDTDRDLTSLIVTRTGKGIASLADLKGKVVGVGAADSPQATLIPLVHLAEAGIEPGKDFEVRRFDRLVGKHGDHIGGERDAAKALMAGEVDACCIIDGNHLVFSAEGTLPTGGTTVLARTEPYDHCNFTVLADAPVPLVDAFVKLLLEMRYDDPKVRPLLDMEGLKVWKEGRTQGYAMLDRALGRFNYGADFIGSVGKA